MLVSASVNTSTQFYTTHFLVGVSVGQCEHLQTILYNPFLGGLSLHLNHLTASHVANYDWPFGTLPFGLFGSNLDTRDLETYPRAYSGHFWNMSLFGDSRAIWALSRKWVVSENQSFRNEGVIVTPLISLVCVAEVPRLDHGPIFFSQSKTLRGVLQAVESWVPHFWHFHKGLKQPIF